MLPVFKITFYTAIVLRLLFKYTGIFLTIRHGFSAAIRLTGSFSLLSSVHLLSPATNCHYRKHLPAKGADRGQKGD